MRSERNLLCWPRIVDVEHGRSTVNPPLDGIADVTESAAVEIQRASSPLGSESPIASEIPNSRQRKPIGRSLGVLEDMFDDEVEEKELSS